MMEYATPANYAIEKNAGFKGAADLFQYVDCIQPFGAFPALGAHHRQLAAPSCGHLR